jgi:hypothetical protein
MEIISVLTGLLRGEDSDRIPLLNCVIPCKCLSLVEILGTLYALRCILRYPQRRG